MFVGWVFVCFDLVVWLFVVVFGCWVWVLFLCLLLDEFVCCVYLVFGWCFLLFVVYFVVWVVGFAVYVWVVGCYLILIWFCNYYEGCCLVCCD